MGNNNVMIDLETMGNNSKSAIISIGAVRFDNLELGQEFYTNVNLQSCIDAGLTMDASTIMWWMKQSDEARKAFNSGVNLADALRDFTKWLGPGGEVWGNGVDFDNVILASAYDAANQPLPWRYWNNRCYRTFKGLCPSIKVPRGGIHHNALDDAKTQAEHLMKILKRFNISL
ncbi:MAG: 3'-5' exoribonuclease [Lentisphaerae bacterium]|nr:3'-5' exoribonuclease [Lentisphaerota bacterium]